MIFPMIQRPKNDRSVQRALPVYDNEMTKVENLIRSWVVSVLSQNGPASFRHNLVGRFGLIWVTTREKVTSGKILAF